MSKHNSKSGLFLMEMMIVIFFFSICAAICINVFSTARITADHSNDLNNAVVRATSAAEAFKASDGHLASVAGLLADAAGNDVENIKCFAGEDEIKSGFEAAYSGIINKMKVRYTDNTELVLTLNSDDNEGLSEQQKSNGNADVKSDTEAAVDTQQSGESAASSDVQNDETSIAVNNGLRTATITVYSYEPSYSKGADDEGKAEIYSIQTAAQSAGGDA